MIRVMSIVGARPQFVKLAPVCRALAQDATFGDIRDFIVHTGQHYDSSMSDVFFSELELPDPDYNLGIGSGSHGAQTARMLEGLERLIVEQAPDMVITYGDTNSTVAGALAAAKLHVPVAHVEAGLRSFDRRMPEELNRIVADHVSDLLLAPTLTAMRNLEREGLGDRSQLTGDIMYDAVLFNTRVAREKSNILERLALNEGEFGVATVHRADNTDDRVRLTAILEALDDIATSLIPIVFPVHPRTRAAIAREAPAWKPSARLELIEPVGYVDMLRLVEGSRIVLTDSGGLQKEAFFMGRPCVTMREQTEWVETVDSGANVLAGAEPKAIRSAADKFLGESVGLDFQAAAQRAFGDGRAAYIIMEAIRSYLER